MSECGHERLRSGKGAAMRAVVQCVSEAAVTVGGRTVGAIGKGYAILLGVGHGDTEAEAVRLWRKIAKMRVFEDEQGRDVKPGTIGEEISRGPNVFVGYLKDREETDRVLKDDGWFYSGDLCVMDDDGCIRIVGRKKDMIVRGGENLNSNYINDAIEGCPGVADHAVIGMPDERLGERICAYVVPGEGEPPDLGQMLAYMKEKHVPKRFWPERLELIGRIPRTGSGKVKKYLLLEDLKQRG